MWLWFIGIDFLDTLGAYILTRHMWRHCLALWASRVLRKPKNSKWMKPLGHFGQPAAFLHWLFKKLASSICYHDIFLHSLPQFQTKPLHDFLPLLLGRIYCLRNQQQMAGQDIYINSPILWYSLTVNARNFRTLWHIGVGQFNAHTLHMPTSQSWRNT